LTGEVDANPDMEAVYSGLLRWASDNYSVWQPEFLEHMRIRYGQRLSGDWPRMAYVSRLTGHMRAMDTVVNDRQHIQTRTLIIGGEEDYPSFAEEARDAADTFPNGEVFLIPGVGHNPHEEVPDIVSAELLQFVHPRQPGPCTTCPGSEPVCSPSRKTISPFTNTCLMPVEYR
jgi:pimeloyl-ACP methyl ester carboxylesterase